MKKFLSTVLAIVLVMGMCVPMTISASAEDNAPDVWDGTANIKWFIDAGGKDGNNYEIKTAEDFAGLAYLVNASNPNTVLKGVYYDSDYNAVGYKKGDETGENAKQNVKFFHESNVISVLTPGLTLISGYDFFGKDVKLCADMVLNTGNAADWAESAPANVWQPIGGGISDAAGYWAGFNGIFDGQGHTVSGLYTSVTTADSSSSNLAGAALFGIVSQNQSGPSVNNLTLENFFVRGEKFVGGIVGRNNNVGSLKNCHVKNGYVVAVLERAGALTGGVYKGGVTITACSAENVTVTAPTNAGGLIGIINGNTVDIKDSYTIASVEANDKVGVIVGAMEGGKIVLDGVYSIVKATANNEEATVGVVCGSVTKGAVIKVDSYYFVRDITAPGGSTGEGTGATTEVTLEAITGDNAKTTMAEFDFENIWKTVSNGTPILEPRNDYFGEESSDEDEYYEEEEEETERDDSGSKDNGTNNTTSDTSEETTAEQNSGCGSSIGIASAAVVALASGMALVIKKKEN